MFNTQFIIFCAASTTLRICATASLAAGAVIVASEPSQASLYIGMTALVLWTRCRRTFKAP